MVCTSLSFFLQVRSLTVFYSVIMGSVYFYLIAWLLLSLQSFWLVFSSPSRLASSSLLYGRGEVLIGYILGGVSSPGQLVFIWRRRSLSLLITSSKVFKPNWFMQGSHCSANISTDFAWCISRLVTLVGGLLRIGNVFLIVRPVLWCDRAVRFFLSRAMVHSQTVELS
jgi:hypothetical protein